MVQVLLNLDQTPLVIGGGLAGAEAAHQLLRCGLPVTLVEARPAVQSPAHHTLLLGELVCSNSLRSDAPGTAPGLLKEEMRRAGSLVMEAADTTRVPAGSALAVNRAAFAWHLTSRLLLRPGLRLRRHPLTALPEGPAILASGPLTSQGLSRELSGLSGGKLYFYDAIAPVVEAASIQWERVFYGARREPDSRDYVNCPMDRQQYEALVGALRGGATVPRRSFEEPRYFEGCLPVEVMAGRGWDVLCHGPLRPVGLTDPRSPRRPHAVVQLRAEDRAGTSFNLVGFQTRMRRPEQRRVFRMIPGLEQARFLRYGSVHRNTYLDAPRLMGPRLELREVPRIKVAGQISGVEGYLESTAMGLVAGLLMAAELKGCQLDRPPRTTALGSLVDHVTRQRATEEHFEPSNITFGLLPPLGHKVPRKRQRRQAICDRALEDLGGWLRQVREVLGPGSALEVQQPESA